MGSLRSRGIACGLGVSIATSLILWLWPSLVRSVVRGADGGIVRGRVTRGSSSVGNARVTLFNERFFAEARSNAVGDYTITTVPDGDYALGASALGLEYREMAISVRSDEQVRSFDLGPEANQGRWEVVGNTDPEGFGGTNSGVLMPDGRVIFCHDTQEPVVFDPVTRRKSFPTQPPELHNSTNSQQGCHNVTHLPDGRILYVGGGTLDAQGNFTGAQSAIRVVKAFDPVNETWEVFPTLNEARWYPGLARLPEGDLLAFGGGQQPSRNRTATSEMYDRATRVWRSTGSLTLEGGFSPAALLYTGEIFISWYPPQIYNLSTGRWRNTRNFLQPLRGSGPGAGQSAVGSGRAPIPEDHPDHSIVVLPDGRIAAIGIWGAAMGNPGSMVEVFDPATETWSLGSSPPTIRAHPEVVQLPDRRIFVAAGAVQTGARVVVNEFGYTNATDLYDPTSNSWRVMAPMKVPREYHAVTLVLPDARVLVQAGTGQPSVNPGPERSREIEVFSPPYLFRGPRPRIDTVTRSDLRRGDTIGFTVSNTAQVTSVRLLGVNSITHFLDAGVQRLFDIPFTQHASTVEATIPDDSNRVLAGYYLLFAMVDDIPSEGVMVRISPKASGPSFTTRSIVNAASYARGAVAAGEVIALFGISLGPATLAGARLTPDGRLDSLVAETRILFDGQPAPILYVSDTLSAAIVPYAAAAKTFIQVEVEYRGVRSAPVPVPVVPAAPGIFTAASSGKGQAAIQHADYTDNSPANPAPRGSAVALYATGEGQTDPDGIDGKLATDPLPKPRLPVTVRVGGHLAQITYVGAAPGQVAGLLQVNFRVPDAVTPGDDVPVELMVGAATSQTGVTMAVR